VHVAIIMGGSERWAGRRGLPRSLGQGEGVEAVRAAVDAAARAGVATLTLYASPASDRVRPIGGPDPTAALLLRYLLSETCRCVERSIRIHVIGRRERMDGNLVRAVEQSERLTAAGSRMRLRAVTDYSTHDGIVRAAWGADPGARLAPEEFHRLLQEVDVSALAAGAVDLLIRTGGERRLSDFMLWETAYAELHFTRCLWPDFDERHFERALQDYAVRQGRFDVLAAGAG
jgi:undecaprenyl diphosphate synthase